MEEADLLSGLWHDLCISSDLYWQRAMAVYSDTLKMLKKITKPWQTVQTTREVQQVPNDNHAIFLNSESGAHGLLQLPPCTSTTLEIG